MGFAAGAVGTDFGAGGFAGAVLAGEAATGFAFAVPPRGTGLVAFFGTGFLAWAGFFAAAALVTALGAALAGVALRFGVAAADFGFAFADLVLAEAALAAFATGFATALRAGFEVDFPTGFGAARRGATPCFAFAVGFAGRVDGFAAALALPAGLDARAAFAAGFAVLEGFGAAFAVRPFFTWAVAFITLPACQRPRASATPALRRTDRARPSRRAGTRQGRAALRMDGKASHATRRATSLFPDPVEKIMQSAAFCHPWTDSGAPGVRPFPAPG